MNAVEIEKAVFALATRPFQGDEFPYAFLKAFGNKDTTIGRLKNGVTNSSDVGGVLQRNNVHLKVCEQGKVGRTLRDLNNSQATAKGKVKYIVAVDGDYFEAENLITGETVACDYDKLHENFDFFLPLAGINRVEQVYENTFDTKAVRQLNRLYTELLKANPDWSTPQKRNDMNHFMAKLIFCFFAEKTGIFEKQNMFTNIIDEMSEHNASNTREIISEIFRAMDTERKKRDASNISRWASTFPYVNGGLFEGGGGSICSKNNSRSKIIYYSRRKSKLGRN